MFSLQFIFLESFSVLQIFIWSVQNWEFSQITKPQSKAKLQ